MEGSDVVDGVRHVSLGPGWSFNAYLVGDVLVDSGPWWARRRLLRALRGERVTAQLLTHAHGDHAGSSAVLADTLGLPIWIGAPDRASFEAGRFARHGHPVVNAAMRVAVPARAHEAARGLVEGDHVAGFEVLLAPGHTPGSVALWRERDRVLMCGDAAWSLLPGRGGLRPVPAALSVDAAAAARSLERLRQLRPRVVLFGHGRPYRP